MTDAKTIFSMRKQGRSDQALPLARELVKQSPYDPWNIRALGWVLCDLIKRDISSGRRESAQRYIEELNSLNVPENDEVLTKVRIYYREQLSPCAELLQKAKQADQQGKFDEAVALCRKALQIQPDSVDANNRLGWTISRKLQLIVKEDKPDGNTPYNLLREYAHLKHIEKPSLLHSLILRWTTVLAQNLPNYIGFVKWWDPAHLRPEDFKPYNPENSDKSYDSLVEQVIKALYHAVRDCKSEDGKGCCKADQEWVLDFIGAHYLKFTEQVWFPYYLGKLLVSCGRKKEAHGLLLPIVREKQSEFWAWELLADTFDPASMDERRACLCKAMLCKVKEESMRVNVHTTLGELLLADKEHEAARREFDEVARLRSAKGWKISPIINRIQGEAWYRKTKPSSDNRELHQRHASKAIELLSADIPWSDAVVTGIKPKNDDGEALVFIGFRSGNDVVQIPARPDRFMCLQQVKRGMPVLIKLATHGTRQTVVAVESRRGKSWDVVPCRTGVVTHVNTEKKITHVALGRKEFDLLHYERSPGAGELKVGDCIEMRLLFDRKQERNRVVEWVRTQNKPPEDFYKGYAGILRLCNGGLFGFVNDIYIHKRLIDACRLTDDSEVSGSAVCEWNEKKGAFTWSAVTIQKDNST